MANIHIREANVTPDGRRELCLIYHIPVNNPKAGVTPCPISSINAELDITEKNALAAGQLVEKHQTIVKEKIQTIADIKDVIQQDWATQKMEFNNDYDEKYAYFGSALNATT